MLKHLYEIPIPLNTTAGHREFCDFENSDEENKQTNKIIILYSLNRKGFVIFFSSVDVVCYFQCVRLNKYSKYK